MPKTKISEFSATPANNTDIDSINIAEGCAPSGINDAIRELMAQLKDFQTGAVGDSFNGPVGTSTAAAGAFTTLSASSTATLSGLTASTALALDASKNVVSVTNTGTGSNVLATSPTLVTPALGTPSAAVLTNATGLPISTGVSGLGTGVATLLATPSSANLASAITDETGSGSLVFATSPTLVTPILGTPTSATLTNATGLPISTGVSGLGTGVATFLATPSSANLAAALTDETGSGANVFATSPTLVTPVLGTPTSVTLTNATGLPISTGVSGLGTGIATALAVNTGSAGAPVLFNGALGTPSSGTVTNLTGTASININGTVGATTATTGAFTTVTASTAIGTTSGGTGLTSFTSGGVVYASSTSALATGSTLTFSGGIFTNTSGAIRASGATVPSAGAGLELLYGASGAGISTVLSYDRGASAYKPLWFDGSYQAYFASGSRIMDLTSTGLGIGTSSPATKLDVNGDITQRNGSGTIIGTVSNNGGWYQLAGSTNVNGVQLWSGSATTAIRFGGGTTFTEQARIPTTGGFQSAGSISVGNTAPTTSGAGITFPATQSASSNANTLDDYEEGTWTPGQGDLTLSAGTFVSSGTYTKIGRTVYFTYIVTTNNPATQTVSISASGATALNLPFAEAFGGTSTAYDYSSVGVVTQVASSRVYFYSTVSSRAQITGSGVYSV